MGVDRVTVRILNGDCRDVLKTLPDESVHCVVTSPPYFGLRDYGVDGQIGLEATPDAFVAEMVAVFREVRRVLRSDGTVWLNLGDSYNAGRNGGHAGGAKQASLARHDGIERSGANVPGLKPKDLIGIPWRVAFALQADGWWLRQDIIWSKPNPMPESVTDRCTKAHEYLFLMAKSARYFYDGEAIKEAGVGRETFFGSDRYSEGSGRHDSGSYNDAVASTRNRRSVWTVPSSPFPGSHFATFPPALIEPCIKAGCPLQCCNSCGAPYKPSWTRGVDAMAVDASEVDRYGTGDAGVHRKIGAAYQKWLDENPKRLLGLEPSCSCATGTSAGTVLDPFGGAGTTGLVADRLGRSAILIELNPDYAAMAGKRIKGDSPLLADVA